MGLSGPPTACRPSWYRPSGETILPSNIPFELLYSPSRTNTQALFWSGVVVALYCVTHFRVSSVPPGSVTQTYLKKIDVWLFLARCRITGALSIQSSQLDEEAALFGAQDITMLPGQLDSSVGRSGLKVPLADLSVKSD